MTLVIQSWCAGDPCDPCKPQPQPPPSGGGGTGLPPFTDAAIRILQYQMYQKPNGQILMTEIGNATIYSAADGIPPQISWGTPSALGPIEYGFSATWIGYFEVIDILHPYYPTGSYNDVILNSTGVPHNPLYGWVLDPPLPSDAPPNDSDGGTPSGTITSSGSTPDWIGGANQAIALANQILGNPT